MPDETTTTIAPSSEPISSGNAPEAIPAGGDALAAQLDGLLSTPPKPEPKPKAEPDKVKPAKEQAKPEPKQPEKQAKPEPEPKGKPEIADLNFAKIRKKLADNEAEFGAFKLSAAEEKEKLAKQIAILESRKVLTPEHEKKMEELQKTLEAREAQLYSFDYSQSPEYKEKYLTKWQKINEKARSDIGAMQVITGKDEESGKETYRNATVADWKRVYDAGSTPEAWRVARELFGDQASIAMDHRNALKGLEEQAQEEVESKRANYDKEQAKQKEQISKWSETHSKVGSEYDAELLKKYGVLFTGDPARPEEAKKVEEGTRFVEEALNSKNMSVEEHAKRSAVLKRWAMSFPLMNDRVQFLQGKVQELEAELSKFRKSDPGEASGEAPHTPTEKPVMGSDDLAKQLEELNKK